MAYMVTAVKQIGRTSAMGNANQGQSVAIRADGNTYSNWSSGDNSSSGAAWVFTRIMECGLTGKQIGGNWRYCQCFSGAFRFN